jgi:hypothetical protein
MFNSVSTFNQPIASWNTASVMDMTSAFDNASAFNQNLARWNVLRVTKLSWAFDDSALSDCYRKGIYTAWGATLRAWYSAWSTSLCTPRCAR